MTIVVQTLAPTAFYQVQSKFTLVCLTESPITLQAVIALLLLPSLTGMLLLSGSRSCALSTLQECLGKIIFSFFFSPSLHHREASLKEGVTEPTFEIYHSWRKGYQVKGLELKESECYPKVIQLNQHCLRCSIKKKCSSKKKRNINIIY